MMNSYSMMQPGDLVLTNKRIYYSSFCRDKDGVLVGVTSNTQMMFSYPLNSWHESLGVGIVVDNRRSINSSTIFIDGVLMSVVNSDVEVVHTTDE